MSQDIKATEPLAPYLPTIGEGFAPVDPVVKWAGGKSQLLPQLSSFFPSNFNNYHEPFLGGGAVFFHLAVKRDKPSWLSDNNEELINFYLVLRDQTEELLESIQNIKQEYVDSSFEEKEAFYYNLRSLDRTDQFTQLSNLERASRFYTLNKTAFNGLFRINSKGQFNVPWGKYKKPALYKPNMLRSAAAALRNVCIWLRQESFEIVLENVQPNGFVYFDPPYVPISETSSFTSYTADGFGAEDHRKLAKVSYELDKKGIRFMLSNSNTSFVRELYEEFRIIELEARRNINSKGNKRGPVTELLILNYD